MKWGCVGNWLTPTALRLSQLSLRSPAWLLKSERNNSKLRVHWPVCFHDLMTPQATQPARLSANIVCNDSIKPLPERISATQPCRPIMCSILIITPADWTANRPIVLACNFTAYFKSHLRPLFSMWQPRVAFNVSAPTKPRWIFQLGVRILLSAEGVCSVRLSQNMRQHPTQRRRRKTLSTVTFYIQTSQTIFLPHRIQK